MKMLKDMRLKKVNNLISLAIFGSYGTKYWILEKSDIDILVLIEKRESIMDELDLEEILEPLLKEYFQYEKIHLTFINMMDYDNIFARQYIDSKDKIILDELKEIDFRLYVNKFLRENSWLRDRIKRDTKHMEENHDRSLL